MTHLSEESGKHNQTNSMLSEQDLQCSVNLPWQEIEPEFFRAAQWVLCALHLTRNQIEREREKQEKK